MVESADILPEWHSLHQAAVAANDGGYADFVCRFPYWFYLDRARRIGLWGHEKVLDVGCGYGQWLSALCVDNGHVTGIERHAGRLAIAGRYLTDRGLTNWSLVRSDAQVLPFADQSFDALLCYGVFMFLDRERTLREFCRVLRPGGRLYVCTNARGWWLSLWVKNLFGNTSVRRAALRGVFSRRGSKNPNATSRSEARRLLNPAEWDSVDAGFEGHLSLSEGEPPRAAYRRTFLQLESVIEFTAKRKMPSDGGAAVNRAEAAVEAQLEQIVERSLATREVDYLAWLGLHPQPRPAADLVNNCDREQVRSAVIRAAAVDRLWVLKKIFDRITAACDTDQQRVEACVRFAQVSFFHHFAGQPTKLDNQMLLDPIASLLLGEGRCGTQARFLVDLFQAAGWPARLLASGCHTSAEVKLGDTWVIADANLFPPGVFPCDKDGKPLSIEEAAARPWLLDRTPSYINYHHEFIDAFLQAYPETEPQIGDALRWPLLPSAAYFGGGFLPALDGAPGKVVRFEKRGGPAQWNTDSEFGWRGVKTSVALTGPVSHTIRRPGQARRFQAIDGQLFWESGVNPPEYQIDYTVSVSAAPRDWSYRSLSVGCTLNVPGEAIVTETPGVSLAQLQSAGSYLTVRTRIRGGDDRIFYLPSVEVDLGRLHP